MFTFLRTHGTRVLSHLPTIIKYWVITHFNTIQCYPANQRELLYNIPTMIATENSIHVLI